MKTLIRISLFLFVLIVITAGAACFIVTRPAFQKKLIESKLPAGSSIKYVKITTDSIQLTDLKLSLADGTTAELDSLHSDFSLWAGVFDNTLQLRGFTVDGLVIKLPEVTAEVSSDDLPATGSAPAAEVGSAPVKAGPVREDQGSPTDALYALSDLDWLFDFDSIDLNGAFVDAARNRYAFTVKSTEVAPGIKTTVAAALELESKQALQGGLKDFVSNARLIFTQQQTGGFEHLSLESLTSGTNAAGDSLLTISQKLELAINALEESGRVEIGFNADFPHPEVFAPELIALSGISLQGALQGSLAGSTFNLDAADLSAVSNGTQVVSANLKQRLTLGGEQTLSGELMQVDLVNLPFAWLNPWLSNGLQLTGTPISARIVLAGEESGALEVKTLDPLQVGPFSLSQNSRALLQAVTVRFNPLIRVAADQTVHFELGDLQVLDRYGAFISGTVSGSANGADASSPFAGLKTQATLDLGIAELLQQPVLAGSASVLSGQAQLAVNIDAEAEYPVQLQAAISGLHARDLPGSQQDYRLAAQLKQMSDGSYAIGANFAAGSENRPTTNLQMTGQLMPELQPTPFKLTLTAPKVAQGDVDLLLAAFKQQEASSAAIAPLTTPPSVGAPNNGRPVATQLLVERPPWADLNGEIAIKVDELTLPSGQTIEGLNAHATVSEALLAVSDIEASLDGGSVGGRADVAFDPSQSKAYKVSSTLTFKNVDPSIFSKKRSGSFPVKGLFDGDFSFIGNGATLELALDDSEGELTVTGRDGVLTAFELDNRSQLGLLGAGILGQSLNRPGISAMAQAVPYFKDMHFDNFALKLTRTQDKKVRIPELSLIGDNLRINGQGLIAASSLSEVLDQPLDLTLGLAAKGRLVDYLDTLQLLVTQTSEDGFRNWNKDIKLGGTLGDPDTSALMEMLNNAARRALQEPESTKSDSETAAQDVSPAGEQLLPGQKGAPAEVQATQKSKQEKLRDEIDIGMDLLNSMFGQ